MVKPVKKAMRVKRRKRKPNTDIEPARKTAKKIHADAYVSRERRQIPIGPDCGGHRG